MAKTCFYCGKELAPGQRCSCRGSSSTGTGTSGSANTSGSSDAVSSTGTSSTPPDYSSCSADPNQYTKKAKKTKQVWNHADSASGNSKDGFSFSRFIDQVRSRFPSLSKLLRPVMNYIWHPVTTIQNRPQRVSIPKVLIINSIFATFTSLMVLFTYQSNSPFLGMLIDLMFGNTDLFSDHPFLAFVTTSAILWASMIILALCFVMMSKFANRKLSILRALDTISMSSVYMCFADILIFFSVLLGTQGAFTLIFVALVIMGVTHYVSIKNDLMLTDNATFNMLAVSYLLFYLFAQLGIVVIIHIANAF
ncbi:MAG: hypothetical protein IK106_00020 [Clostridiales bacterium]|nr:hypothetical protein [Clostridiales bacterium]